MNTILISSAIFAGVGGIISLFLFLRIAIPHDRALRDKKRVFAIKPDPASDNRHRLVALMEMEPSERRPTEITLVRLLQELERNTTFEAMNPEVMHLIHRQYEDLVRAIESIRKEGGAVVIGRKATITRALPQEPRPYREIIIPRPHGIIAVTA